MLEVPSAPGAPSGQRTMTLLVWACAREVIRNNGNHAIKDFIVSGRGYSKAALGGKVSGENPSLKSLTLNYPNDLRFYAAFSIYD